MKAFFASLATFFLLTGIIRAQPTLQKQVINPTVKTTSGFPEGSEKLFNGSMKLVNARHAAWIKSTAKKANEKNMSEGEVRTEATSWAILGSMPEGNIEALCFLVLMQAAKSSQEDLKGVMSRVKAINNQKAKQREILQRLQQQKAHPSLQLDSFRLVSNRSKALIAGGKPDTVKFKRTTPSVKPVSKEDMEAMADKMKTELDTMNEMGEMEQLRLQMIMDRRAKMMEALSNIMKKISDTVQGITRNLK
jgi:hypothetical protein